MKVAVSSLEPSLESKVDERFGRAACLLVVDTETFEAETIDNKENAQALKGSGFGAAEAVCGHGVHAVLTGHLGPNAFKALEAAGVPGYGATGMTAKEAVERFLGGELERLSEGESNVGM